MRKRVAHGGGADQLAADPADGRAFRRPGRADQGDHADRTARTVGATPAVGPVHHARPRRGSGAGRPGAGHDQQPRLDQGEFRHRSPPPPRRGAIDPPRTRASWNCRTRSGPLSRTRSTAPTPAPQVPHDDHRRRARTADAGRDRSKHPTGSHTRQEPPPVLALDGPARLRRFRHRRLATGHREGLGRPVLLRPTLADLEITGPAVHPGHRIRLHLGRHRDHPERGGLRVRSWAPPRASPLACCSGRTVSSRTS